MTQSHSTRQLHLSNDLARLIDVRHAVAGAVMIFVWLAERIVAMAVDIEAYEDDQVWNKHLIFCKTGALGETGRPLCAVGEKENQSCSTLAEK